LGTCQYLVGRSSREIYVYLSLKLRNFENVS
jgi:hypothetical protein